MMKLLFFVILLVSALFCATPVHSLPIERRGASFKGEGTFFTVGLGSCGKTSTDSDLVVALSSELMSSGDYCGKKIKVKTSSGSVTATVVDTCPSCAKNNVDFSTGAFKKIGSFTAGRINISWSFA